MKTETLPDPKQLLATYQDKDDLLFYLKTKFESPSIELYISSFGNIEGFTCASLDGVIYSTLRVPATIIKYNYSTNKLEDDNTLLKARTELYRITLEELANSEKQNFFLKVACGFFIIFSTWLFIQHHRSSETIEKLKTEISKPVLIQDTI